MRMPIELDVNGARRTAHASPEGNLLGLLRDELGLTGSKYGCGEGQCGACMVLLDGQAVPACITPVVAAMGRNVTTIEGVADGEELHPLQQAFVDLSAMQCGYCTPGMIVSALALLRRDPEPSEAEIVEHMRMNICRCGSYPRIVQAVRHAAEAMRSAC
jgi:aerobic-type carbon monoxide dehydrogenase small subunit (CoxS/CutS family)